MISLALSSWLPRPSNKYHGWYPLGFEKYLSEWLGTENYVHFFAGMAKTGYRIDINPNVKPDLIADVQNLKQLKSNSYEAGMADPPYNEIFAKKLYNCEYPQWSKWTKELVRLVKPNGLIGIMQNYICPLITNCQYEKIFFIPTRIKQFPKIVTIYRKNDRD